VHTTTVKNMKELGAVIKAARENLGIPQKVFAEDLNVSPQYLVGLEGRAKNLFGTRLFRAIRRLGITVTITYPGQPSVPAPAEAARETGNHA
jgi:transcriptional regulator with XRE-family HTH domain